MKQEQPAVLLVDCDPRMKRLRQAVFRNHEINVRLASSLGHALGLCRVQRYDLVLSSTDNSEEVSRFCEELWKTMPKQRVALLVGPPVYLRELREKHRPASIESATTAEILGSRHEPSPWRTLFRRFSAAG